MKNGASITVLVRLNDDT